MVFVSEPIGRLVLSHGHYQGDPKIVDTEAVVKEKLFVALAAKILLGVTDLIH